MSSDPENIPANPADQPETWTLNLEHLARVYRFVLSLIGSQPAAQAAVERVYRRALAGMVGAVDGADTELEPLLVLACSGLADDLRAHRLPDHADTGVVPTGFDLQVYQIADGMARLEPGQAVLLALHFFAGLDLPAAARVLGISARRAERASVAGFHRWLAHTQPAASQRGLEGEAALAEDLFRFAESIEPPGSWAADLEKRLREALPDLRAAPPEPAGADWRRSLRLPLGPGGWSLGRRLAGAAVALALVALLVLSFELTPREGTLTGRTKTVVEATAVPLVRDAAFAARLEGTWVAPPAEFCEVWRMRVQSVVDPGSAEALENAPLGSIPGAGVDYGWGCRVTASIPAGPGRSARILETRLVEWITGDGYDQDAQPNRYILPGRLVRLMVSGPADCPEAGSCAGEGVTITLEAAENRLSERVERLFSLWQEGIPEAGTNLYMTGALARRYPNSVALDDAVGISRTLGRTPAFTWRMLENAGQSARIEVTARGLLERDVFQMIWVLEDDEWVAADLGTQVVFPPTQDRLIGTDPEGRVVLVDLDSGEQRVLTPAQVYSAAAAYGQARPAVSPDGKWLAVTSSGQQQVTFLSSLQGDQLVRINHRAEVMAWSPDSRDLAMVAEDRPGDIARYHSSTNVVDYTCRQAGEIRSLSWSPDGTRIALTVFIPDSRTLSGQVSHNERLQIKVVSADCSRQVVLHTLTPSDGEIRPTPYDLAWSEDGSELWYRDQLSIRVANQTIRTLVRLDPIDYGRFDTWSALFNDFLYQFQAVNSTLTMISPNEQFTARSEDDGDLGTPRHRIEILDPAGEVLLSQQAPVALGRLTWTADNGSLVLSESQYRFSRVWRMNPYTGAIVEISDQLGVVGLVSELQGQASRRIPGKAPDRVETSWDDTDPAEWPLYTSPDTGISFQTPPGWSIVERSLDEGWTQFSISNLKLNGYPYPVRLEQEDVFITMYSQPWTPGQNYAELRAQFLVDAAAASGAPSWRERVLAGRVVYELDEQMDMPDVSRLVYLPTEERLFMMMLQPQDTRMREWFEAILASIRFPEDEPLPVAAGVRADQLITIEQVRAAGQPVITDTAIASRRDEWQAELAVWDCVTLPGGQSYHYEELRLSNPFTQERNIIDTRLGACPDPHAERLGGLRFSPGGEQLFYTVSHPQADGQCAAPDVELYSLAQPESGWGLLTEPARQLGVGPVWEEASGQIALWQGDWLALLNLQGAVIIRYPAGEPGWQPGPIAWAPGGESLAYLRYQSGCPASGAAYLQRIGRTNPERIEDGVAVLEWTDASHIRLARASGEVREFIAWERADLGLDPAQPTPTSTPAPQPTIAAQPLPDATQVMATVEAGLGEAEVQTFASPNGRWTAELVNQSCRPLGPSGQDRFYYRLRILDANGKLVMPVYEKLGTCGLGMPTIEPLAWSSNSRFFYYSHHVQPDGGGCISDAFPTILRVEPATQVEIPLQGSGPLSPNGRWLAWREGSDLVLWPLLGAMGLRRVEDVFDERATLALAWLPDSILAIQNPNTCFPLEASSLVRISFETWQAEPLYEPSAGTGPALIRYLGEHNGFYYFMDVTQQSWRLDLRTGALAEAAWPILTDFLGARDGWMYFRDAAGQVWRQQGDDGPLEPAEWPGQSPLPTPPG